MNIRSIVQTVFGVATYIPGVYEWRSKKLGSGGTYSARYCYSVWMRHIIMANNNKLNSYPRIVAELGPGDSLGMGLMALLLGSERYYAFDVVKFANIDKNLSILDELIKMLLNAENIPDDKEFPRINPHLDNYNFPKNIYSKEHLTKCLNIDRINKIKNSLKKPDNKESMIIYKVPWFDNKIIKKGRVDMIMSQAVLEHIDDLDTTYKKLYDWLKKDGFMSHAIDFKSHGYASTWDGHFTISDWRWKLLRGKRPYLLNREVFSTHKNLLNKYKFNTVKSIPITKKPNFEIHQLNKRYKNITEEDRKTSGVFIQANKI